MQGVCSKVACDLRKGVMSKIAAAAPASRTRLFLLPINHASNLSNAEVNQTMFLGAYVP